MKSLNIKNTINYVKENYMLSRERMTVYTQYSSEPNMYFEPQFICKGKGKIAKVDPPEGVFAQWSDSGSYKEEQMLKTIDQLPKLSSTWNQMTGKIFAIYMLDNYR